MSDPADPGLRRPFRISPVLVVLIAIVSVQTGSSFAKALFETVSPYTVTLLRVGFAPLVLLAIAPPRLRGRTRADWAAVGAYGLSLAGMNLLFYLSIERIPIGLAVTLEFLGPLLLAVRGAKHARDLAWVGLAALGVAMLGVFPSDADVWGLVMATAAGLFWAAYILIAGRVGQRWSGSTGLTAASGVSLLLLLPGAVWLTEPRLWSPAVLGLGLVVAVLSTVVPYALELSARRQLRSSTFSILMSLEPGAAAVLAWLILGEFLGWQEWLALVCVVIASIGATRGVRARRGGA